MSLAIQKIANELAISEKQVNATIQLLEEGATVPFIARYRKEATHGLEDHVIERIQQLNQKWKDFFTRKAFIIDAITEQGKMTAELTARIEGCFDFTSLEDIYLPFKPKRKTRATTARELGLEPLAQWLIQEPAGDVNGNAERYVKEGVEDIEHALQGARDIISEWINEDGKTRNVIRQRFEKYAVIESKVVKGKEVEGAKYSDYFKFEEPAAKCPSHRLLALFRSEAEGVIRLSMEPDQDECIRQVQFLWVKKQTTASQHISLAAEDAYKRLLSGSMETELRAALKWKADEEAIRVFAENAKQLLLAPPLGNKRIMAIDPGFRTGCKVVCLNEEGKLLHEGVIYPHEPQRETAASAKAITEWVKKFNMETIAVGNGTAGRESELFLQSIQELKSVPVFSVNESGASIYSASEIAREEFPDKDVTVRGAVSIGRRLADPLAELVKIDPKSIGVGQYQHDVDQPMLKTALDNTVLNCVNSVGINVNSASASLLTYVSGLGPQLAKNIVKYRDENGPFTSRATLKKVPRLGEKAFEQCAGFLRVPQSKNVLDRTAVHPERYDLVKRMATDVGCSLEELIQEESLRQKIEMSRYTSSDAGEFTLRDILNELAKPGRDPRGTLEAFEFSSARKPEELIIGSVIPGIVTNITAFGCFVNIGVKQDGLVHISQLSNTFVKDPYTVVKLGQHVNVRVIEVDMMRKRIALSMKNEA